VSFNRYGIGFPASRSIVASQQDAGLWQSVAQLREHHRGGVVEEGG
jgi:hypothetical protein